VELQLEHNAEIKSMIDLAWGVQHNKHKKKEAQDVPPDPSDPRSKERLQLIPIGQDTQRKRYWIVDGPCMFFLSFNFCICAYLRGVTLPISIFFQNSGVCRPVLISIFFALLSLTFSIAFVDSPRIYVSSNPWKMAASFQSISSTREEYIATVESLKASGPTEPKANEKRSKIEQGHLTLVKALEERIEAIDFETSVSVRHQFSLLFRHHS
jgi:hypothetical protein